MRLYYILKNFFKNLKSNLILNFIYFLIVPLAMSSLFGSFGKILFQNPNITEIIPITVSDNDNSNSSKNLFNFIDKDLNNLYKITDKKDDADIEIIIPNDYEESLLNNKSTSIEVKKLTTRGNVGTLIKDIIDEYHDKLYYNSSKSSFIKTSMIQSNVNMKAIEYFAIYFLGFLGIMFIMQNVSLVYLQESNGLKKRMNSMPISKFSQLFYDFSSLLVYSLIFILLYLMVYRYLNIAFTQNIGLIILLALSTSIFISTSSIFIGTFFSKKYGQIIITILLLSEFILGGIVTPFVEILSKLNKLSPFYLITDLFTKLSIYNNLESILGPMSFILIISLILFIASVIKENYSWREF